MKRIMTTLLALCMLGGFTLAGCSSTTKDELKTAGQDAVEDVKNEAGKLGEEAKAGITEFINDVKADTESIVETLELKGKATLDVVHEDEKKVVYKFTEAEDAAALEAKDVEAKVKTAESHFAEKLTELKNKGVADAEIVVQYFDKEGKELYSKVFK